jgi:hypothetical protein
VELAVRPDGLHVPVGVEVVPLEDVEHDGTTGDATGRREQPIEDEPLQRDVHQELRNPGGLLQHRVHRDRGPRDHRRAEGMTDRVDTGYRTTGDDRHHAPIGGQPCEPALVLDHDRVGGESVDHIQVDDPGELALVAHV